MNVDDPKRIVAELGLADRLRSETSVLHREAERTGIIADLLRGRASRTGYGLLLRNLLPVYETLEQRLRSIPAGSPVLPLAIPALYRAAALRSDLDCLMGPDALQTLPILPATQRYVDAVLRASGGDGALLIAHAYTRYLGDLNGGQILRRLLAERLGVAPGALTFYRFAGLDDPASAAARYRAAIDAARLPPDVFDAVLEEGVLAFRLNIEVSLAVSQYAGQPSR